MIREVFILLLLIQVAPGLAQTTSNQLRVKQVLVGKVLQEGFEAKLVAPAAFVRKELWRQTKTFAAVEPSDDFLKITIDLDSGESLILYGHTISVEDAVSFLSLTSENKGIDDYLKGMLLTLKSRINITYYQNQINKLQAEASGISAQLGKQTSRESSSAHTLWEALSEITEEIEKLRMAQREILRKEKRDS